MTYAYWKWDNEISNELISLLEKECENKEFKPGELLNGAIDKSVRNNVSIGVHSGHWFAGILYNYALHANQYAGWSRTIEFPEILQISKYATGEYYNWHTDTDLISNSPFSRKVTVVCLLNDPSEFTGGDFEIKMAKERIQLQKGSIIAFPSVLAHRVTPLLSGVRKSAVVWASGPNKW